jgi:TIR domain/Pentapeptide repeats (8 copies)
MANQEQFDILKQGVEHWNQWRQEHPNLRPDLSSADLSRADLNHADLSNASLFDAKLFSTNFFSADLSNTSLNSTNLFHANLASANLSYASLSYANLSNADLFNTNFTCARFFATNFAWVDLSHVKGLETAIHGNRSSVDINSVILPKDEMIRKHFLLGVGFTETQIEYLPSLLTAQPLQYHSLFISYAHQDEAVAKRLHTDLRKNDVPCWFAPEDMKIGDKIRARINEAIHFQEKLLLLLSEHALASSWVEDEVEAALEKERKQKRGVLFPVRLDESVMQSSQAWAINVRRRHIGDFTKWTNPQAYQIAFDQLLRDLKQTS